MAANEKEKSKITKKAKVKPARPALKKAGKKGGKIALKADDNIEKEGEKILVSSGEGIQKVDMAAGTTAAKVDLRRDPESKTVSPETAPAQVLEKNILSSFKIPSQQSEINEEGERPVRSIGLYKKIALAFIFLTAVLVAVIFYFSFVKVSIKIIPNQERLSNNLIFDVYDKDKNPNIGQGSIEGVVKKSQTEMSKKYQPAAEEVIGEEAVGIVSIVNNYIKNQPLVASTRILSADGKLFRIKETVNVPAGGSAEAEIYADSPSPEMAIGPTKFTIPGLWAGLQDKIYAESNSSIKYQKQVKRKISQTDVEGAVKDLKDSLVEKAKSDLRETYKDYDQVIYSMDDNSITNEVDGKVGEEKDEFTVTMKADVLVVAFKDDQIAKLAKEKINSSIPETEELIDFDKNKIIYSLNSSKYDEGVATVNAIFEGKVSLKNDASVVEKDRIVGLTKAQLNEYLGSLPEVAGYEVKFSPSFISKVPDLVDRISIEIKK